MSIRWRTVGAVRSLLRKDTPAPPMIFRFAQNQKRDSNPFNKVSSFAWLPNHGPLDSLYTTHIKKILKTAYF
jgi:hypothetical protein